MDQARTLTAYFWSDTWTGTLDKVSSNTYTITSENSEIFKVACSGSTYHNQFYKYIGNVTAPSGTVTLAFNNTSTVLMKGTVKAGGTSTVNVTVNGNRTLKRAATYNYMFNVDTDATMNINTANSNTLTLDGGSTFATAGDGRTKWTTTSYSGTMMHVQGALTMKKTVLQNSFFSGHAPSIRFNSGRENHKNATLQNVEIKGMQGPSVLIITGNDFHNITWTNVKVYHCMQVGPAQEPSITTTDAGGIIRTNGNTMSSLKLSGCEIYENEAKGNGAAILWNATGVATGADATTLTITDNTKIHDNIARGNGGGVEVSGIGKFSNCEIYNNEAGGRGGGLEVMPNGGGHPEYPGTAPSITIGNGTKIHNNTAATYGGGIFFFVQPHNDVGWDANNNPISPEFKLVVEEGGHIYGNKAKWGAGIAIYDEAANKHKNTNSNDGSYNKWSGVYRRTVNITGGTVYDNQTQGTGCYGAGIYIKKAVNNSILDGSIGYNYTNSNLPDSGTGTSYAGTMNVTVSGGVIYKNYAKGGSGGGIYITDQVKASYPTYGSVCNCNVNNANAKIYGNSADNDGGGVYVGNGNFSISNGQIGCNTFNFTDAAGTTTNGVSGVNEAKAGNGGGVYVAGGNFTMSGGYVQYNKATKSGTDTGDGGGFYVTGSSSTVDVSGGYVRYNKALSGRGGGFYVSTAANTETKIRSAAKVLNNQATNGGGAYIALGTLTVNGANVQVNNNEATSGDGGGIYALGTVTATDAAISANNATNGNGGGIYAAGNVTIESGTTVTKNTAKTNGGGIYVNNGTFSMTAGTIGGYDTDNQESLGNKATTGNGGGVYVTGASAKVDIGSSDNTAEISYNLAESGDGGGVYVDQTGTDGTTLKNAAKVDHNKAINGGGVFVKNGKITVQTNSTLTSNTATGNGGGIYANGGTVNVSATTTTTEILKQNSAVNGGGIYANGGTVNFSNGVIKDNTASHQGGGIYIPASGKLTMKGTAKLTGNHVPAGNLGGGVYLAGVVEIGEASKAASVITAEDNYAGSSYEYVAGEPDHNNRNNIYLPNPVASASSPHRDVITLIEDGLSSSSHVGFSVPRNFVPVIYCAYSSTSYDYLDSFLAGGDMDGVVFDDAEIYTTVHQTVDPYDYNHIYLSGTTWVQAVTSQPASGFTVSGNNVTISTNEGLAWLISYVNNLNGVTDDHSEIDVTLTADVDMSAHSWVPVAFTGKTFTGTFDGNGHTISGVSCNYLGMSGATQTGSDLALFGNVSNGGSIKNVYLKDANYSSMTSQLVTDFVMGSLVANLGSNATVSGCTSSAELETQQANTVMGGLVGSSEGAVHSSYSASELIGFKMGGLVGDNGGDLYNSFANPLFEYSGESGANAKYVGGLVAENDGTVQNCYVRFSRTQELTGANFGQLAGDNENSITDCYTPLTFSGDVPSTIVHTGSATSDTYKVVDAPYLYNRPNDNLVGSTGKTLTEKLNNWVSAQGTNSDYAFWKRSTAGGYSYDYNNTTYIGGNINDDYPIHKMKGMSCAASPDGLFIHYKASLNRMITDYNTLSGGGTLWLYASPKNAAGTDETASVNNNADVKLYIDEDATLLQAANNSLTAYTSQTLKVGTEARWHFISSSLTSSAIGFNYGSDYVQFSWAENPCNVTFSGNEDNALFPSDMPNINKVDLYAFYEPEYHWLNMKRNTNSHWHMNSTTTPITYIGNGTGGNGNETYLVPGKGYLASIDKDQLLQNKGTLNNGSGTVTVQDVTYNEDNAWAGLLGYNLLGNPYQSYLDFHAFINDNANSGLNASKSDAEPTYAVYDPEVGSYIQYKSGSSKGSRSADGMLHPHQGFLIRRTGGSYNATATFKNTMRSTNSTSPFRGEQPAFPLVNLTVTDDEGNSDVAVLELGRDTDEGAEKLRANTCKGWLYLHHGTEDYAILFRSEVEDYQPLWFEASEAGTYTLSWETANADFEALTLVDNIAGTRTDMLANGSYVFESDPEQYKSRFKIVIGNWKDIDEYNDDPSAGSFAFVSNGNLVVNGEGTLQLFDVTGRCLHSATLNDSQTMTALPNVTAGVYVLRLTNNNGTRTQKIILN